MTAKETYKGRNIILISPKSPTSCRGCIAQGSVEMCFSMPPCLKLNESLFDGVWVYEDEQQTGRNHNEQ